MVVFKLIAAVSLVLAALSAAGVSAQTHHVLAGQHVWGPALDVNSWLSGRVFRVGDKIWFNYAGTEDSVVELKDLEEFVSCNFTNPIKMYTDHVSLEKEGVRYFTSGNIESCKNGLKLSVPVEPSSSEESFEPSAEEFGPPEPFNPFPPTFGPPPPAYGPPPPQPKPTPKPEPTPTPTPSAATHLMSGGVSFVLIVAAMFICYI